MAPYRSSWVDLAGLADHPVGFLVGPVAVALLGLEVELHPEALAIPVPEREGVRAVAVNVAHVGRQAAVREQGRDLVQRFGRLRPEVPHCRRAAQVGARMALLRMDEIGKLQRIAHEEHRRVVADHIPVAFLGVELHREAAHVALGIGGAEFAGHRREARDQLGLLADRVENFRAGVFADVVGNREGAVSAPALGMHDALGDALAVVMGHLLDQLPVLHQYRAARACGQAVLIIGNRRAGSGGVIGAFAHGNSFLVRIIQCVTARLANMSSQ